MTYHATRKMVFTPDGTTPEIIEEVLKGLRAHHDPHRRKWTPGAYLAGNDVGVNALKKPQYTPCTHCVNQGCAIYQSRPEECQTYRCLWLVGEGEPQHRPDKLGVIVETSHLDLGTVKAPAVVVREVVPGACERSQVRDFIGAVAYKCQGLIYVVRGNNTRSAFFPPWATRYARLVQDKLKKLG